METLELTWRALTAADAAAVTRLLAAAELVDDTGEHYDESDVAEELADPSVDLARDTLAAVGPDGELVAYASLRGAPAVRDVDRIHVDGTVLPAARRHGLGRRLLEWAEPRAAELHAERHPGTPAAVALSVPETVPSKEALARARGYTARRWWYEMRRDLGRPLPEVPPVPAGLTLVPYQPERDEQLRLAHVEAFAGHWGSTPPDAQRWGHWYTGATAFQPGVSRLVLDGDEIAAYLNAYYWAADEAATGVKEAYVGQIGVRPAWRRRGLGSLLLADALAGFAAAGYGRSSLSVDSGNATGALGLYERAGYEVHHRAVTWEKEISGR